MDNNSSIDNYNEGDSTSKSGESQISNTYHYIQTSGVGVEFGDELARELVEKLAQNRLQIIENIHVVFENNLDRYLGQSNLPIAEAIQARMDKAMVSSMVIHLAGEIKDIGVLNTIFEKKLPELLFMPTLIYAILGTVYAPEDISRIAEKNLVKLEPSVSEFLSAIERDFKR